MKAATSTSIIHDILAFNGVCAHFQPILSARQRSIVGLEASSFGIPVIPETAIRSFAGLKNRPDGLVLFMHFEPSAAFTNDAVADQLFEMCLTAGISPQNVAIEIFESRMDDFRRLTGLFEQLRRLGFLVVLGGVTGNSNFNRIPLIKPDILKVHRSLIENINSDYYKQETLKSLVGLCRRIGALVVAEGVETEMEAIVSLEMGADLLQGFLLGSPQEITDVDDPAVAAARERTEALGENFKSYMVGKINERKLLHRRFSIILNQLLCELTNTEASEFDDLLSKEIVQCSDVECVYVLDQHGTQITETISNPEIPRQDCGVMFHPALKGTDHSLKEYYYLLMDVELQKFTTDPYVSLASGKLCRTISTTFRDAANNKTYVLCIDIIAEDDTASFASTQPVV